MRAAAPEGLGGAQSIFAQGDVAPVVRAFFDRAAKAADGLNPFLGAVGGALGAGDVGGVVFLCFYDLADFERAALAPHGDKLPAAAQAGLFGSDGFALHVATLHPRCCLVPAGVVFR